MADVPNPITSDALSGRPDPIVRRRPGRPPNAQRAEQREDLAPREQRDDQRLTLPPENTGVDYFGLRPDEIPDGQVYQGIAHSVLGQENRQRVIDATRFHWTMVPASRHPHLATEDPDRKVIMKGGQGLYERPAYLDKEARRREKAKADGQMRTQFDRLRLNPTGISDRRMPGQAQVRSDFKQAHQTDPE